MQFQRGRRTSALPWMEQRPSPVRVRLSLARGDRQIHGDRRRDGQASPTPSTPRGKATSYQARIELRSIRRTLLTARVFARPVRRVACEETTGGHSCTIFSFTSFPSLRRQRRHRCQGRRRNQASDRDVDAHRAGTRGVGRIACLHFLR
jgi:hypothetical protein